MSKAKRTEKLSVRIGARKRGGGPLSRGGGRRSKSANPVERVFDDLKKLVTDAAGQAADRQTTAKKTAGDRQRKARRRQAKAKQTANARRGSKAR